MRSPVRSRSALTGALTGALTVALCAACQSGADTPDALEIPATALPAHDAESLDGFTQPNRLLELSDGRVVLNDPRHRELWVVDFSTGARAPFGRVGDGPGEFRNPQYLALMAGDSVAVVAGGPQVRVSVIAPDGTPVRTINLTADPTDADVLTARGYQEWPGQLEYSDAQGRLYGALARLPMSMELDTTWSRADQLVRIDPSTGAADTLTLVPSTLDGSRPRPLANGSGFEMDLLPGPFQPQSSWTVLGDGTVAVVHGANYTVQFSDANGTREVRVPSPTVSVTADAYSRYADTAVASFTRMMQGGVPMDGPDGTPLVFEIRAPDAPAIMPATISGPRYRVQTDGAALWVPVPVPGTDPLAHQRWDVISTDGARVATYDLPARSALLAVTPAYVYTVLIDDDDLRTLRRHPRSSASAP